MNFLSALIPLPMHALDLDLSCRTLFQCSVVLDKDVPSGLLFNVFINDVLDGVAPISVPGLSQKHHPRGLMFADDIAIIAPLSRKPMYLLGTIADWATRWEMSFGVAKCGGNSTLARRPQAPVNTGIRMILKAPLFTPIAPMLTDCGIISLDAHAILARRSKYALERTFQVWGKSKLACSYVQANYASSANFCARRPSVLPGHRGSLLSLARCGGLWDYPRALKADLLHPTATDPTSRAVPACILCHAHLDCKPMAHLV
ncbi:hypothetical protein BASA83_013455, partial [Batrachochytrium salamandrivorans]